MDLAKFFGFGKDTLLEWFIQMYHLEAIEFRDDPSIISDFPSTSWLWKGSVGGTSITIPTGNSTSKFRIDGNLLYVHLGQYGGEKNFILYRPRSMDGFPSLDDRDWEARAREGGIKLDVFVLDPDCNCDPFLNITTLRLIQEKLRSCSEGVDAVVVSLPGVVVEFKKSAETNRVPNDMRCAEKILEIARKTAGQ